MYYTRPMFSPSNQVHKTIHLVSGSALNQYYDNMYP